MLTLAEKEIICPYCGEQITVFIDDSIAEQSYIEDCSVCCQAINFRVCVLSQDEISVNVFRDDE
jgi:transcription elongation factor Elf1